MDLSNGFSYVSLIIFSRSWNHISFLIALTLHNQFYIHSAFRISLPFSSSSDTHSVQTPLTLSDNG